MGEAVRLRTKDDFGREFPRWYLCDGASEEYACIRPARDDWRGVTYDDLRAFAEFFGTTSINVVSEYDGPYSDVTPGNGFDAYIEVRPTAAGG
jgi:hypothetical protein